MVVKNALTSSLPWKLGCPFTDSPLDATSSLIPNKSTKQPPLSSSQIPHIMSEMRTYGSFFDHSLANQVFTDAERRPTKIKLKRARLKQSKPGNWKDNEVVGMDYLICPLFWQMVDVLKVVMLTHKQKESMAARNLQNQLFHDSWTTG